MVYGDFRAAALGAGAALNGALAFPSDNDWNRDISGAPVDPNCDALIASIGNAVGLDPDFGAGEYAGGPIGVPSVVVAGSQARVTINWTDYGDESDPGPYPVPADAPIEGGSGSHAASRAGPAPSADAAPGPGGICHALRITVSRSPAAYVPPATITPRAAAAPTCRRWACACG